MVKTKTFNNLIIIVVVILLVLVIGLVGRADTEDANRPNVCREYQGSTICYKP